MAFENYTVSFKVIFYKDLCTTISVLSKIVSVNAIAFVVLTILHGLVSIQKTLLANNC